MAAHESGRGDRVNRAGEQTAERVVVLKGDLWRVKVEDNNCYLRLKMSAMGQDATKPRVIADIPAGPGYEGARVDPRSR